MVRSFKFEDLYQSASWDAPDRLNIAHETVDRHPDDRVAMRHVGSDGKHTAIEFGEIAAASNQFANALESLNVSAGDRVFTYLPRLPEHYVVLIGTLKVGAIFGAINERYGPDGIRYRLEDASASVVVTTAGNAQEYGDVFRDVTSVDNLVVIGDSAAMGEDAVHYDTRIEQAEPNYDVQETAGEDRALLYYTSGTTGPPKGVVHTHQWVTGPAASIKYVEDLQEGDLYWSTGDMGWLTGPVHCLGSWFWGHPIFIYQGEFDPEDWVSLLNEYPISVLHSVPTAYRSFVEHEQLFEEFDVDIRHASSIGEPLDPSTIEWGRQHLGVIIHDTYGQTESGGNIVTNLPTVGVRPGSMGKRMPDVTAEVVDPETGEILAPGDTGELAWKDDIIWFFKEYWGDAADKDDSYVGEWFLSGDLAYKDEDGYFWFEGRADDVILSSGYRIGPFEVESALTDHPAVTEAAVVPKPDERRGNIVKAFVKLVQSAEPSTATKDDITKAVRQNLSKHEYPREIEFVEELPKTVTGKIRRKELREQQK